MNYRPLPDLESGMTRGSPAALRCTLLLAGSPRASGRARLVAALLAVLAMFATAARMPALADPVPPDEGFGVTAGGDGEEVYRVTSLADSLPPGPGTLRDAVSLPHRRIVFDVAGDIRLVDYLFIRQPYVTIDGLSAPAPGITLRDYGVVIRGTHDVRDPSDAHDIIIRGLRVRDSPIDTFQIADGAYGILISNVSVSGAGDGAFDITDSHDVTVAWNAIAHPDSGKSMLIKYDASRVSLHHNAFVGGTGRHPSAAVDDVGTPARWTTLDMRNNLVWDWGAGWGTMIHHGAWANVVANLYSSPGSDPAARAEALIVCRGECFGGDPTSAARAFVAGNLSGDDPALDLDALSTESAPFAAAAVITEDACTGARRVLGLAGVRPLDALDAQNFSEIRLPACTGTRTSIASSPNPSEDGQRVTYTATVTVLPPGTGPATGTVTFMNNRTVLGTGDLVNGLAQFATAAFEPGRYSIAAVYDGDDFFEPSTSTTLTQVVRGAVRVVTELAAASASSRVGEPVTLSATVSSPQGGTPTGTVTFRDGPSSLGKAALANGVATLTTATIAPGYRTLTAAYAGDINFASSTSAGLAHAVAGGTAIQLSSSPNPARTGETVALTAVVTPIEPAPVPSPPTGRVTFRDGSPLLATVSLAGGSAMWSTSSLVPRTHPITAVYEGSASFAASAPGELAQRVLKGDTLTSLVPSSTSTTQGVPVTLQATVTVLAPARGTPSGTVRFFDGTRSIGSAKVAGGSAALTVTFLGGNHALSAAYGGDAAFEGSTAPGVTVAAWGGSTTALRSSLNPSRAGQAIALTAVVAPIAPSTATPAGRVTFRDSRSVLGSSMLVNGVATYTTAPTAGSHSLTATYEGAGEYVAGVAAALAQKVTDGQTTTTLTSSSPVVASGASVTFTATVQVVAPAAGTATGLVTFRNGKTSLGRATLTNGVARFTTAALPRGVQSITAVYAGDANFLTSTSPTLAQEIR